MSTPVVTRSGGLDGPVQCENIGLERDAFDGFDVLRDPRRGASMNYTRRP
jgi:hypothetical protein